VIIVITRLKHLALAVFTACLATVGISSFGSASPFSALNIDFLGRGGGTYGLVANAGEIDNVFWNASGLGFSNSSVAVAGYMDYLVTVGGGTGAYMGLGKGFGYGIHASYLSSDTYAKTALDDQVGQTGETFKYGEFVLGVSGGTRLRPYLSVGTGLKLARYDLDDVAGMGVAADLSGTLRVYPLDDRHTPGSAVYVSLVTRNLGLVRWEDEESDVPRNSELGLVFGLPGNRLAAGASYYLGTDGRREIRFGMAALPTSEFEARLGYRRRVGEFSDAANNLPWERGITGGFGIGFGRVWIDYTFEDASPLDNIHRFAVRAGLGRSG
jgi:hypothetical protein